ncbi:MAG: OmpA family protein, partial [Spirochaetales bacterium]|nr:OmpA family protein [Spirochaetales bacterium]
TPIFSPNGDGRLDTVAFVQETEEIPLWTARIENETGEVVRRYDWAGRPDARLLWDGRTADGERAPDGRYRYVLSGTDRAGNARAGSPVEVELDTRETPVFVSSERDAFSPNDDGVVDSIDLITELADPRGVERFELAILDGADRTVARITDRGTPQERYEWDGRGATGRIVADGAYRVRIEVEYRHGNRPSATSAPFRVDTVEPRARVELADTIFSPDGDGRRDAVTIRQESSREALWTAEIIPDDGGRPVRRWDFSGELAPLEWDGTDEDGAVVEDGRYRYRVSSVDGAGNRFSTTTPPFRADTREVEVRLRLSEAAFSPNGDGVLDSVDLVPGVNIESPIAEWALSVEDTADGETIFETAGDGELETVTWRGEGGTGRAPDGLYRGRLRVRFARGDEVEIVSARSVVLDTVAPAADVALSSPVISPNGDGILDELVVSQTTSEEERWVARVLDDGNRNIGSWEWVGRAEAELAFAGLDDARRRVSDGMYAYLLQSTDRAGNSTTVGPLPFEVYTAETPLELYPSRAAFSPNGDGAADALDFRFVVGEARGLERFTFVVESASGEEVVRTTGAALPERFNWNGRIQGGGRAEEGRYRATLELEYRHGNRPAASTAPFLLDTTPPALAIAASEDIFSPDDDGRRDRLSIRQSSDAAEGWRGRITSESGDVVREYGWTDRAAAFEWDGTDVAGNVVADGRYRYVVEGTDAAGNTARGEIASIEVDTRTARLFVTLDRRTVSPNGDGVDDRLEIGMIASRQDGAEYRLVEIVDESGRVVEAFRSEEVRPRETLVWDGLADGTPPEDGRYTVRFSVGFRNGALPQVASPEIILDTAGPELAVNLAGLPFSPDNDGLNDELSIGLTARDASDIAAWSFEILDRTNTPFQRFDGSARPRSELVWDGRSNDGELVISAEDYPYRFSAVDTTGNHSEITGTIPIDILVVRDGDLLRIQISNINFEPDSPELQLDPGTEQGAKNISVLDRLVEVFDKYRTYEIRVEGHAVNLSGTAEEERTELEPLSTSRAETVRTALVERGMDIGRISVEGRGGTAPIVPHTDRENRWKNRRVEFILIR